MKMISRWLVGAAAAAMTVGVLVAAAQAGTGVCSIRRSYQSGDTVTAADYVADLTKIGVTNLIPTCIGDYSDNLSQMQTTTDPYPGGVPSLPTTIAGEIERLRYAIKAICGWSQWYAYTEACSIGGGTVNITGKTLTLAQGTITAAANLADLSVTWNEGSTTFTGVKLNVVNTASAAASKVLDVQVGGVSTLTLNTSGVLQTIGAVAGLKLGSTGSTVFKIVYYTPSLSMSAVSANKCEEQTNTVTGLAVTDTIFVNATAAPTGNVGFVSARVTAPNTIGLTFCNPTGTPQSPNGTFQIVAFKMA